MSLLTAPNELKKRFSELLPFLKEEWKILYLDFFTEGESNAIKIKTYFTLVNISRSRNPVSPSPSIIENVESLIKLMSWTT